MGHTVYLMFIAVNPEDIPLPIVDWMQDNISDLLENAFNNRPESGLFSLIERHGYHLYEILNIKDSYNLSELDFLNDECTTLQGKELLPPIRALTVIIDKLLSGSEKLLYTSGDRPNDQKSMQTAFEKSQIIYDANLEDYEEDGLFIILKALLLVMTDALANNKVFLYINYGC